MLANNFRSTIGGQKIHVIILAGTDPWAPKVGGVECFTSGLFKGLLDRGIKARFIGIKIGESERPLCFMPVGKNVTSGFKYLLLLILRAPFLKIPDNAIIHAQLPAEIFPFTLLNKKNPKVCTLSGKTSENVRLLHGYIAAWIYKKIEEFTLHRVDRCIAVNENTKQDFLKKYPWLKNKINVVVPGADLTKFRPMEKKLVRKQYNFSDKDKIIMYIGRFSPEKNLGFLINVFEIIKNKYKNYKLVLVGDGREKTKLIEIIEKKSLKDVIFTGPIEYGKIPEILNCADLLALCSLNEGSPAVVKEALACGIPVVSVRAGDVKEFVNEEVGRVVVGDEEEFAESIIQVLKMDKHKVKKSCEDISRKFSLNTSIDKIISIYMDLQASTSASVELGF